MKQPTLPYLIIILLISGSALAISQFRESLERQSTGGRQVSVYSPAATESPAPSLAASGSDATVLPKSTPIEYVPVTTQAMQLAVPFTVQAPDGDWIEPWKEGCEEAALIMADAFINQDRREVIPSAEAKQKIYEMVQWEIKRFGGHKDLGVEDMAIIAKEYLGYTKVKIKKPADLKDIKDEIRLGKPVIVPMAGRLLRNPYFQPPGPYYHVFVIVGFEGDTFIANENGTKRGQNYRYSARILNKAWHDFEPEIDITKMSTAYLVLEN